MRYSLVTITSILLSGVAAGSVASTTSSSSSNVAPHTAKNTKSTSTSTDPNVVSIDKHTYTALYSGFTITESGSTRVAILPTKSPVTIGTDVVSLGPSGELVIDSSTVSLLKTVPTDSASRTTSSSTKHSSSSSSSKSSSSHSDKSSTTSKESSKSTSKTTAAPVTSTHTAYPAGFLATKVTTGVTTNGHTTSSKNGHVTIIPVLGGPKCWFCPQGDSVGGIQLPGISFPGIFPPPPAPPGFSISINAPSITIDSAGDPTFSSEPTKSPTKTSDSKTSESKTSTSNTSSKSSCTKSVTASICTSSLIYYKATSGSSITSTSTTTKCDTTVACSASDRTTTVKTTTSASGASSCVPYPVPSIFPQQADEDDEDAGAEEDTSAPSKRSSIINGRRSYGWRGSDNDLVKRAPNSWAGPSQCSWGAARPGVLTSKVNIKAPNYPAANLLNDWTPASKSQGNSYLWLVTKADGSADSCQGFPWDYTQVSDGDLQKTKNAQGQTYDYNSNGKTGALVNADHVYEIKLLKYFFTSDAPSDSDDCDAWLKFWIAEANVESPNYGNLFGKNSPPSAKQPLLSRMQTVFKLLPGTANPSWTDFVGMDKDVNGMKGALLENGLPDCTTALEGQSAEEWIQTLNLMGLAQKMLRDDNVASRFATTNSRIYGAMQQIDSIKGDCAPPEDTYASKYSSWIENYLSTQGEQVQSAFNSIVTTKLPKDVLTTTLKDDNGVSTGEVTTLADNLAAITKAYPAASLTYDLSQLLSFPAQPAANQAITIKKRDGSSTAAIPAACAFTSAGASSTASTKGGSSAKSTASSSSTAHKSSVTKATTSKASTGSSNSKSSSTGSYTVTVSVNKQGVVSPIVGCDFSANSCAHVACAAAGTTAQCTANMGTNGGQCDCLGTVDT